MKKNSIKDWTVLIYADGNNELEPEIWKSKLAAEKTGSSDNINVIMQIGRESSELVKIIRPFDSIPEEDEHWTGVRRYYIQNSESILISDLGKINMADPHNLYNFIIWGIKTYPSKHFMLILAGHGFSYIAAMTDLSQDIPYVMGVPQMCKVLNMIQKDTGVKIDILVLDMCYMNTIEVLYELGKTEDHTVDNVLTYINDAPLDGLPYDKLLYSIEKYHTENNLFFIMKSIIDTINLNLVAIKINHGKLKKIKKILNKLACSYLNSEDYKTLTPYDILNHLNKDTHWYEYTLELQKNLKSLIIYYKNKSINNCNIIDIVTTEMLLSKDKINYLALVYYSLSFCKNNCWINVLTQKSLDTNSYLKIINTSIKLEPIILPRGVSQNIRAMNPSLKAEAIKLISHNLFAYKKWDNDNISNKLKNQINTLYFR